MAEADDDSRTRSFRHSHDLANLTYGHFGIPSYHVDTQQWTFQRQIAQTSTNHVDAGNAYNSGASAVSLKRIHQRTHSLDAATAEATTTTQISSPTSTATRFKPRQALVSAPELIAASACIKHLEREAIYGVGSDEPTPPTSNQITFGRAPHSNTNGQYTTGSQVPFFTAVSSQESSKISLWPVQPEATSAISQDIDEDDIEVPSLHKLPMLARIKNTWSAPLNEPILQLCYLPVAHMIAYRQSSASTLCLAFADDDHDLRTEASRDQPRTPVVGIKQVLTFPLSRTGNHPHADIALSCATRTTALQMAVTDTHGNYSVWEITGRRSLTTRLLYQARLRFSGKLWSWSETHPPPRGVSRYFDGWHKICFLQPNSGSPPVVLVANRQKAILCDEEGNECQNVHLRLESKSEWLLDIWSSHSDPSKCIFLTCSKILLLKLEKIGSGHGLEYSLGLVCSASHFLADGRPGLRMSVLELPKYLWVFLYSGKITLVTLLVFHLDENNSLWTVNDPSTVSPFRAPDLGLSAVMSDLVCLPIYGPDNSTLLLMVVAKYLDGHVTEALHLPFGAPVAADKIGNGLIVPWPGARRKMVMSDRIIDDESDDDHNHCFVVDDDYDDDYHSSRANPNESQVGRWARRRQPNSDKDWSWIYEGVDDCEKKASMNGALEDARTQMHPKTELAAGTALLRELIPAFHVDDIEDAENSLLDWREEVSNESKTIQSLYPDCQSFSEVYEQTMSRFVESLSDNVANRLRVNTERVCRQVAMDLTLSSLIVDQAAQVPPSQSFDEDVSSSATQQPSALTAASTSISDAARSRLGKYASFAQQWQPGKAATSAIESILAHLPEDFSANPDEYSYSGVELELARKKLQEAQEADPTTKRRAERMEAIRRKRAEKAQATGKITLSQETPIFVRGSSPVSQGMMMIGMSQPERGDFGTRSRTKKKNKKKQSQSQRAGF